MRDAAKICKLEKTGNGETVTIEALRRTFTTAAWADLKVDDSRITRLIEHPIFKNRRGKIDANWLICFGFLNCPASVEFKSKVLYSAIQRGGPEK